MIKGLRYLATEIDSEKVKINGFYSDWTMPTFHNTVLALRFYDSHDLSIPAGGLIPVCSKGFPYLSV